MGNHQQCSLKINLSRECSAQHFPVVVFVPLLELFPVILKKSIILKLWKMVQRVFCKCFYFLLQINSIKCRAVF